MDARLRFEDEISAFFVHKILRDAQSQGFGWTFTLWIENATRSVCLVVHVSHFLQFVHNACTVVNFSCRKRTHKCERSA